MGSFGNAIQISRTALRTEPADANIVDFLLKNDCGQAAFSVHKQREVQSELSADFGTIDRMMRKPILSGPTVPVCQ
jgi:hypothetical protein